MSKTLAVAIKELRQISRDPLTLFLLMGLPSFLLVIFGFAVNFDVENLPLGIQDRDLSPASRALAQSFVASRRFALTSTLSGGDDPDLVLQTGGARAVLVIPEKYGERLAQGQSSPVQLLLDGSDSTTANTALGYAGSIIANANATLLGKALRRAGSETLLNAVVQVRTRVFYNPELKSSHFLVPGLIGFVLMITAVLSTALSVVREKERGTMEQLGVAPIHPLEILVGKTMPYLVFSLLAAALILLAARLIFGVVVMGSYVDLFLATALYLFAGLAMGLLVSTVVDSQGTAFQLGVMVSMLPALILSGFVFPIRNMPAVLQVISQVIPARHYLIILRGIVLKGAGLAPYWEQITALGVFTVVMLGIATVRFTRMGSS